MKRKTHNSKEYARLNTGLQPDMKSDPHKVTRKRKPNKMKPKKVEGGY